MIKLCTEIIAKFLIGVFSPKKDYTVDISKYTFLILAIVPMFVCFFGMKLSK